MNKFDAILFDLNGTLIEIFKFSEYEINLVEMAEILDVPLEDFKAAWSKSYYDFPYGNYPSVEFRVEKAIQHLRVGGVEMPQNSLKSKKKLAAESRWEYIKRQLYQIRPHLEETLDWILNQNYIIGLISNCSAETPIIWQDHPLNSYFPTPSFSSELGIVKPDAGIFKHQFQILGITRPERCIYVADGDDGEMDAARALGMTPILLTYPLEDAFRHKGFPECKYTITDFNQLPDMIQKIESE